MNKLLFILVIIIVSSCKSGDTNKINHSIEGNAPGLYNGMRIYLNKLNAANRPTPVDTAIVMDGSFHFDSVNELDFPQIRFLTMDTGEDRFVFIQGKEPLKIEVNKDTIWSSNVTGSEENRILSEFRSEQFTFQKKANGFKSERGNAYRSGNQAKGDEITREWMDTEEAYKNKVINTVKSNPKSLVSSMILGDLINGKLIDTDKAIELFALLEGDVKESSITKSLETYLNKFTATAIGAKAPIFEGKTPDNKILKLEDAMGKVTLIDFWASWCGPCRRENPNVVNAYKKYHDRGFNIISVSLDKQNAEAAWKAAIEKDQMDWHHISRLMHWQDPIAKQYNV